MQELKKTITLIGKSVIIKTRTKTTCIISDTHIGYDSALNKQGIMVPPVVKKIAEFLRSLSEKQKIDQFIINGDILHSFSGTDYRTKKRFLSLINTIKKINPEIKITLIKGNHDIHLKYLIDFLKENHGITGIKIKDYLIIKDILITHGHRSLDDIKIKQEKKQKINTIIMGHEHPAVILKENNQTEKYKTFLIGKTQIEKKEYRIIITPSFIGYKEGINILSKKMSPLLKNLKLNNCLLFIVSREIKKPLFFGTIKDIRNHLATDE